MATPRKHWFRVGDSILREPLTMEQRGMLVSLMAWLNQRWARDGLTAEEAGRATLGRAALVEVSGRTQFKSGVNALRTLGEVVSIAIEVRGQFVAISWPKFAEFQGLSAREQGSSRTEESRGIPPPQTPPQTQTQDADPDPAPPARSPAKRTRRTQAPESLSADQMNELSRWASKQEPWAVPRLDELAEACLGHFRASGKPMADWYQTAQNWIRNERTRFGRTGGNGNASRPGPIEQAARELLQGIR